MFLVITNVQLRFRSRFAQSFIFKDHHLFVHQKSKNCDLVNSIGVLRTAQIGLGVLVLVFVRFFSFR